MGAVIKWNLGLYPTKIFYYKRYFIPFKTKFQKVRFIFGEAFPAKLKFNCKYDEVKCKY
jgi:hypothetical protein